MTAQVQKKIHQNTPTHDDASSASASDSEDDEEEGHVHGDHCNHTADGGILNRNEKKARKILMKMGLKPITGIERVTIKRSKNMIFAITNPEVYKSPVGDSYIVFGEAKVEDLGYQAQALAAQRLAAQRAATGGNGFAPATPGDDEDGAGVTVVDSSNEAAAGEDIGDLDEKDIKIVMEQGNVSRSKAIQALKAHDGDIVNTIMDLTVL